MEACDVYKIKWMTNKNIMISMLMMWKKGGKEIRIKICGIYANVEIYKNITR